jgi:dihydrofolate synthase/folylpolyglutamate synthase
MSYKSTIEYLYGLQKYGMKFGLDNIRRLTASLGDPHHAFRTVHVAGTNGKGSTSAMIESILRTGGVTTGLFTSPHLVNFTERIRINGEETTERDIISLAEEVRETAGDEDDFSPTFFEVVTAMAFLHFRKMKVEWAVIETGLGGRLDATNVVVPEVSVITRIGFDHREFLGNTLREIAAEKAGIIKERVPVVTATQAPEAMEVLERLAAEKMSQLFGYGSGFSSKVISESPEGVCFDYHGGGTHREIKLPLAGVHQVVNASMAVKAIEVISEAYPLRCDIRKGLEEVSWPGRLEMVNDMPPVLIDGAHNPQAAEALSLYLKTLLHSKYRRIVLVAGIMGDKDIDGILKPLLPLAAEIIFTSPSYGRAAPVEFLVSRALAQGYAARSEPKVADAMNRAGELSSPGDLIVATGSFYTIGEVKEHLGKQGVLTKLRE